MRALGVALLVTAAAAQAAPRRQLRVCADPNNLPFSNDKGEGLENAVARLVAGALDADLVYTWLPQRRGFVRNTLAAQRCDVMMEAPVGYQRAATTRPYYRSSYVFVTRAERRLGLRSFDDARLRALKIGLQLVGDDYANPPPAQALARRGLAAQVRGYPVYGDYSKAVPLQPILDGLERGDIDVAVVWGPLAGWMAQRSSLPLSVTAIVPAAADGALPLAFDIGMGVRRRDDALRAELDGVIRSHRRQLTALLRRFGVPLAPPLRR